MPSLCLLSLESQLSFPRMHDAAKNPSGKREKLMSLMKSRGMSDVVKMMMALQICCGIFSREKASRIFKG